MPAQADVVEAEAALFDRLHGTPRACLRVVHALATPPHLCRHLAGQGRCLCTEPAAQAPSGLPFGASNLALLTAHAALACTRATADAVGNLEREVAMVVMETEERLSAVCTDVGQLETSVSVHIDALDGCVPALHTLASLLQPRWPTRDPPDSAGRSSLRRGGGVPCPRMLPAQCIGRRGVASAAVVRGWDACMHMPIRP